MGVRQIHFINYVHICVKHVKVDCRIAPHFLFILVLIQLIPTVQWPLICFTTPHWDTQMVIYASHVVVKQQFRKKKYTKTTLIAI